MSETLDELLRTVQAGRETVFDFLDEDDEPIRRIEIARRDLQPEILPEPPIARAEARNHVFHDLEAFCEYVTRESDAHCLVLADVNSREIVAVLNETQETDRESVTLKAVEHPLFAPWSQLLDTPISVVGFALFCMKHRRAVVDPDGRELAMTFSQVKMSKAITLQTGVGKKSINGVMVDVEIAGERKGVAVELPETITIEVPLFVGTAPQQIELDLLVTNKGDDVVAFLTAADVERQRIAAFEEMVSTIKATTGRLVGLGCVQHREWKTLRFHR